MGASSRSGPVPDLSFYKVSPARSSRSDCRCVWVYFAHPGDALSIGLLMIEGRNTAGHDGFIAVLGSIAVIISGDRHRTDVAKRERRPKGRSLGYRMLLNPIMKKLKKPTPDVEGALIDFRFTPTTL